MRGFYTLGFVFLLLAGLPAQEAHFSFQHLSTDNGLSSNEVNAIAQDSQGYLWIATSHGLQRYDGIRFQNFYHDPDDERTIPSNVIRHLHFDSRNNLWLISGEGQAGIFDTRKRVFKKTGLHAGGIKLERAPDARFIGDAWGNIFILENNAGLFIWNERKGHFDACAFPAPASRNWQISGFAPRPGTSDYLLSFGANGLFLLHTQNGVWEAGKMVLEPLPLPGYPKGTKVYNIFVDHKNRLWAQTWPFHTPRVHCFDLASRTALIRDYEPVELIGGYIETGPFFESREGAIWLYGDNIFARYNEDSGGFQLVQNSNANNRAIHYRSINVLFEGRENTIWAGTEGNGLFSYSPGKEYFRNIEHFNKRMNRRGLGSPTGFIQLADSTVLVSVWGDGLYRYDRHWNELPFAYSGDPELKNYSIWSMHPSKSTGIIWMSSQPGRIIRYDQRANSMEAYRASMLEDRTIRQVVEGQQGDLWLGMQSTGVFHWKCGPDGRPAEQGPSKFDGTPDCRVSKMILGSEGLLWVATENHGLYVIDPGAGRVAMHLSHTSSNPNLRLPEASVSSVLEYNDSLLVISGPSSLHLFNRKRKTLARIKPEEDLAGYIAALALGQDGAVWVSTTSGLYRLNIHNQAILKFGRRDGLDDEYFIQASSYTLPDGRILFGASETFVVFDPAVFNKIGKARPEARITGLQVNNRLMPPDSVEEEGALRLRHYQTALSIEFSTLQFHRRSSIRYKMEGLDQDWQANGNNVAVYSYLPAGSYRFLLQPVYADGTLGPIRSLPITRYPPFWQAWWFYSLVCLAFGGIIFLFDRERMYRRKSVQQMRAKIADRLHAEVRTALNSIHILSEMAAIKSGKEPARAAGYLKQINSKSQQMMQAMDDMLWALEPENDSMSRVVERIEAYVHKLRSEGRADIGLLVGQEVRVLALDMQQRQMLLRLVKESAGGLLKAGARSLQMYLGRDKMQLSFVVGFDTAEVEETALNNLLQAGEMVKLLSDMGATPQMEKGRAKGELSFGLPL